MLVDDVKRQVHAIVDGMFQHLDVRARVTQSRQVFGSEDLVKVKVGQGRSLSIHLHVPAEEKPLALRDEVTVERLERSEWSPCAWSSLVPGDIVRFRNHDGCLQRDNGYRDPEDGRVFVEVRDWTVSEVPRIGDRISTVSSVRVEPHDFDLAKDGE